MPRRYRPWSPPPALATLSLIALLLLGACAAPAPDTAQTGGERGAESAETKTPTAWALAIHGGAGAVDPDMPEERREAYRAELRAALEHGRELLDGGASALDTVQAVVRRLEDSPLFNAGKGSVFTHEGRNELDAAIMDGRDLDCGSITGVTTVKNPILLARAVMDESRHVFFSGDGAETFAAERGLELVEPEYFFVQERWDSLQRALEREKTEAAAAEAGAEDDKRGTVGAVARDRHGDLAAATSTGGLTNKRFGRVGDVPVIGAGTYADNATAAVSCTGIGEQFIRHNIAHDVSALVAYRGLGVEEAARTALGKLDEGDGGLIAVGADGSIALVFNTPSMFRGAVDADGRFEVGIW